MDIWMGLCRSWNGWKWIKKLMAIIFAHAQDIPLTENHIKQLHRILHC